MIRVNKIVLIALALALGIIVQVTLLFLEKKDTPNKAVTEFVKAYVSFDADKMTERVCGEIDSETVKSYVYEETKKARDRGFGTFYMSDCLYHVQTHTLEESAQKAKVRLVCERKGWLRSFFTGESDTIDQTFEVVLVKDEKTGQADWKVCKTELL